MTLERPRRIFGEADYIKKALALTALAIEVFP